MSTSPRNPLTQESPPVFRKTLHIFPKSEFNRRLLRKRGYDDRKVEAYVSSFNSLCNLQLLTQSENQSKNATMFDAWIASKDDSFRTRHLIPNMQDYSFDYFEEFSDARTKLIETKLNSLA